MWWLLSTAIMLACCMQLPCWEVCFYSSWTEEDNPEMRSTWQGAPRTCAQPRGARWRWERVASLGACCPRESRRFTLSSCPLLGVRLCFISARDVLLLCRDRLCQYKMLCCTELLLSVYGINFLFQIGHIILDSRDYWNPRAISDDLAVTVLRLVFANHKLRVANRAYLQVVCWKKGSLQFSSHASSDLQVLYRMLSSTWHLDVQNQRITPMALYSLSEVSFRVTQSLFIYDSAC